MNEILGKIGFEWQVALANLINFLIIFFILKKFAFEPIGKMIRERREKIEKGITDAQKAEKDLANADAQKTEIIRAARASADKIVIGSQTDGKEIVKEAQIKANREREEILKQAKLDVEKEKSVGEETLRLEASKLITGGMKKMIESYVAAGKGDEIISGMLASKQAGLAKGPGISGQVI